MDIMETMGRVIVDNLGYSGIIIGMCLESFCIPLISETIMPFAGFLVSTGRFDLWIIIFCGTIGDLLGALLGYGVGYKICRPFIEKKRGGYILNSTEDINILTRWFDKYGDRVVFLARNIPIVRTFVSFPAGISKMRLSRFIAYTAVGSFPWCLILGCVGLFMGENWQDIEEILYNLNVIVSIFLLVFIGIFIGLRLKRENKI